MRFEISLMTGEGVGRVGSGAVGYVEADSKVEAAAKLGLHMIADPNSGSGKMDQFRLPSNQKLEVFLEEIEEISSISPINSAAVKLLAFYYKQEDARASSPAQMG